MDRSHYILARMGHLGLDLSREAFYFLRKFEIHEKLRLNNFKIFFSINVIYFGQTCPSEDIRSIRSLCLFTIHITSVFWCQKSHSNFCVSVSRELERLSCIRLGLSPRERDFIRILVEQFHFCTACLSHFIHFYSFCNYQISWEDAFHMHICHTLVKKKH